MMKMPRKAFLTAEGTSGLFVHKRYCVAAVVLQPAVKPFARRGLWSPARIRPTTWVLLAARGQRDVQVFSLRCRGRAPFLPLSRKARAVRRAPLRVWYLYLYLPAVTQAAQMEISCEILTSEMRGMV